MNTPIDYPFNISKYYNHKLQILSNMYTRGEKDLSTLQLLKRDVIREREEYIHFINKLFRKLGKGDDGFIKINMKQNYEFSQMQKYALSNFIYHLTINGYSATIREQTYIEEIPPIDTIVTYCLTISGSVAKL